ncbi:hypothetical protein AK812_SmicGene34114 [Symbiodinium microadriaticum]|uniref:Uncharacterized protein n=1 Tax=Symbiodinium microadriaticum TaxID=2951 RepID=A0A1Q9CPW5_SYMMI|nr:hypothetical protein AK812_SmicGene34114 [Symbiodinium microadriaticum]
MRRAADVAASVGLGGPDSQGSSPQHARWQGAGYTSPLSFDGLSPTRMQADPSMLVPVQHPAREARVTVLPKAEMELGSLARKRHQGIRPGDTLIRVEGREVATMDGQAKGAWRQLVFKRTAVNHLRWLREGPLCSAARWEDLRAEEERRMMLEKQTVLAEQLAAKVAMTQEAILKANSPKDGAYVRAEAELYAAKNLREEKEKQINMNTGKHCNAKLVARKMEAMVEEMARRTEDLALQKLATEHEVLESEKKAEAEVWRKKQGAGLKEYLEKTSTELATLEAQEDELQSAAKSMQASEAEAARSAREALAAAVGAEESSAQALERERSHLQERLKLFKTSALKSSKELDEEEAAEESLRARLAEKQQGQEQRSQAMQHWFQSEEHTLEVAQRQLDFDEKNLSHQIQLLRNQEQRQRQQLRDQEAREKTKILQEMEVEMEADKRRQELEAQQMQQRIFLRQGQLEHELQRLQEQLVQDEQLEHQTVDAVARAERHLRQQQHQSELLKQEESQQSQDVLEQEKLLQAQRRRLQELTDRLRDLQLQQKMLADKEDQMRTDQLERQGEVLKRRQDQQLRQCQLQLQEMRSQQEQSDDHFRSKLDRVQKDLELWSQRVKELEDQLRRAFEVEAAGGKEDQLQLRLAERKSEEVLRELKKIREDLHQQSTLMAEQEQRVQDQEKQLSDLQAELLREIEELPDARAIRKKLEADRQDLLSQRSFQEQQQKLRAEQQQRLIARLDAQLQSLIALLAKIQGQRVLSSRGREEVREEVLRDSRSREEWLQELRAVEVQQRQIFLEERLRIENYEEVAEHWKSEKEALLRQEELAEAAARDAERQAMDEAARHLAEGKLVKGADLEVIFTDPGPVGLAFFPDDDAPARVRKVRRERKDYWERQRMREGAEILAVGNKPTAHMTATDILPLLNERPLRLQFKIGTAPVEDDINSVDGRGMTSLMRTLEAGDEELALELMQDPGFTAINVQDLTGKTALHWAAVGGLERACAEILSTPEFQQVDAEDRAGKTAYEEAWDMGQMEDAFLRGQNFRAPEGRWMSDVGTSSAWFDNAVKACCSFASGVGLPDVRMDALEICLASLLGWKADARLQVFFVDALAGIRAFSGRSRM